ncbi:MAG: flavodoxin-dependent (E)-4-hydroxy-3-methylbut-2-enyl-diphosphate synthase [Nitrospira sp.]|nr:flavodoxin-dependent (E)-4-hydroxy-3-methylbut-2-enyl-diphosphate synthase [Nitrospira sp.]MCB9710104.1 flavodoxin-dependent (E)-4-hydroxy-3-methylbut-2-enyl-diphosphate synthase [Nitrospiraceae bacterium]HQU28015.1 flavodoxin-dependent (E)-4-hydroxy-3-methylbut-2-enyl-diphosphate synthase [Nitrospirales bacterium]MCA9464680.1 flavodoxin-dependent (E)-4-hydroxy-3-methylbut-2-enyl-diphosphate synthase [Nitrospira sp.]MCA9474918.1 flavodoxin-dependent (E)-4-hydroxy-3-methylbut-2-enyl-diphospha
MHIRRRPTKQIQVGPVKIGGNAPISVQSMTIPHPRDVAATLEQVHRLEKAGCELIRVAVPDMEAADALPKIKSQMTVPLIADIHFDHRLALKAAKVVDCVRINPGNIGPWWKTEEVIKAVNDHGIPLRVGVNGGSLEKPLLEKYGYPTAEALAESALNAVHALEDVGFTNMKVSLKASDVHMAIDAYWLFAQQCSYPLHIGITEAGTAMTGAVKSALGLGWLLTQGIGDTLRVSLAADPVEEVKVGFEILKSLELRHRGVNVIACPTCGRVEIDVVKMANELENRLGHITTPITVSVLGCVVNGIGEGKEADIGIAGGQGVGILFKKGKLHKRVPESELLDTLIQEVELMAQEQDSSGGGNTAPHTLHQMAEKSSPPYLLSESASRREIPVLPAK